MEAHFFKEKIGCLALSAIIVLTFSSSILINQLTIILFYGYNQYALGLKIISKQGHLSDGRMLSGLAMFSSLCMDLMVFILLVFLAKFFIHIYHKIKLNNDLDLKSDYTFSEIKKDLDTLPEGFLLLKDYFTRCNIDNNGFIKGYFNLLSKNGIIFVHFKELQNSNSLLEINIDKIQKMQISGIINKRILIETNEHTYIFKKNISKIKKICDFASFALKEHRKQSFKG